MGLAATRRDVRNKQSCIFFATSPTVQYLDQSPCERTVHNSYIACCIKRNTALSRQNSRPLPVYLCYLWLQASTHCCPVQPIPPINSRSKIQSNSECDCPRTCYHLRRQSCLSNVPLEQSKTITFLLLLDDQLDSPTLSMKNISDI